jgi:murein DD-endopeptidase MepM/ murein hydrolase activator NlpD
MTRQRWCAGVVEGGRHRRFSGSARALAAMMAIVLVSGCSILASRPTGAPYTAGHQSLVHVVRPGETVYSIAQAYGVSVVRLMRDNNLSDPRELRVGQYLTISGASRYGLLDSSERLTESTLWNVPRASRQFAWPVWSGTVTSGFGIRDGVMHNGVDITAPEGTPVHAADAGVVAFVARLPGYGNTIIIRHSENYLTVYANNKVNLVRVGQRVRRDQVIGEVGTSGRITGPHLYFQVRYDNLAYNPLSYLSPPGPTGATSFANGPSPNSWSHRDTLGSEELNDGIEPTLQRDR